MSQLMQDLQELLFDLAYEGYQKTTDYQLHRQQIGEINESYENEFNSEDQGVIEEYLDTLDEIKDYENRYYYRQGIADGIALLQGFGVIR